MVDGCGDVYSNSAAVSLLMLLTPYDSPDAPPGIYIERERTRNRGAKKKKKISRNAKWLFYVIATNSEHNVPISNR